MIPKKFALAILSPGAGAADIVSAATKNKVNIINKELYDPSKNYAALTVDESYGSNNIKLLFVFNDGHSVLADTEQKLKSAMQKIYSIVN